MEKRPEIDGLRGLACLLVLIFHALAQYLPARWTETPIYLTGTARLGVWLFFVLSAFLLTLRLLDGEKLTEYAFARFLRIVPLFVAAVLIYYFFGMIGLTNLQAVASALTFQSFHNHLWTVPIEFEFYLLLPLAVSGLITVLNRWSIAAALTTLATAIVAITFATRPWINPDDITFWRCMPSFGWGIFAAMMVRFVASPSRKTCVLLGALSLAALVFGVLGLKLWHSDRTNSISGLHPLWGALWAVFTYAVYSARTVWSGALSFRPLAAFGLTIYSTYLFHWLFMDALFMNKVTPWFGAGFVPLSIALSIGAGAISYHAAEKPLYRLRQWLR